MEITTQLFLGDCKEELRFLPENSVDLIVTSPPYADQRKKTYGGIRHEKYVEWFSYQFLSNSCVCLNRQRLLS